VSGAAFRRRYMQERPEAAGTPAAQRSSTYAGAGRRAQTRPARGPARACTSETARCRVSCHHQSALGASTRPTSASFSAPRAPATSPAPRAQRRPSRDVATPAGRCDLRAVWSGPSGVEQAADRLLTPEGDRSATHYTRRTRRSGCRSQLEPHKARRSSLPLAWWRPGRGSQRCGRCTT